MFRTPSPRQLDVSHSLKNRLFPLKLTGALYCTMGMLLLHRPQRCIYPPQTLLFSRWNETMKLNLMQISQGCGFTVTKCNRWLDQLCDNNVSIICLTYSSNSANSGWLQRYTRSAFRSWWSAPILDHFQRVYLQRSCPRLQRQHSIQLTFIAYTDINQHLRELSHFLALQFTRSFCQLQSCRWGCNSEKCHPRCNINRGKNHMSPTAPPPRLKPPLRISSIT